jgi:acyl-CoA reductase-like NAD-dependent aldehyde dehydrogenase
VAEAAGRNLSGVVAELGGKGPTLVFADADIIEAVNGAGGLCAAHVTSG